MSARLLALLQDTDSTGTALVTFQLVYCVHHALPSSDTQACRRGVNQDKVIEYSVNIQIKRYSSLSQLHKRKPRRQSQAVCIQTLSRNLLLGQCYQSLTLSHQEGE